MNFKFLERVSLTFCKRPLNLAQSTGGDVQGVLILIWDITLIALIILILNADTKR